MKALAVLIAFVSVLKMGEASHYRGGTFSITPTSPLKDSFPMQMKVEYRVAWRMASSSFRCNKQTIVSNSLLAGEGTMRVMNPRSGITAVVSPRYQRLRYLCTDFDTGANWSAGYMSYNITIATAQATTFKLGYSGCCWIRVKNGGSSSWNVYAEVNVTKRADTGLINSSPRISTAPVLRVMKGCMKQFTFPSTDPDNDVVKCRFANTMDECNGACPNVEGYATILDPVRCVIEFDAENATPGLYRISLRVEDFVDESSITRLSSVPIEFLIEVFVPSLCHGNVVGCEDVPEFVFPTPALGSCVGAKVGEKMELKIASVPFVSEDSIDQFITLSPHGLTRSDITKDSSNISSTMMQWTPSNEQYGTKQLFCFSAQTGCGIPGEQRCMFLNVISLKPILSTIEPPNQSEILKTQKDWTIEFDSNIQRPDIEAKIYFYETSGSMIYSINCSSPDVKYVNNKIQIRTEDIELVEGVEYTIALDRGVAMGMEGCGSYSDSLNQNVWIFRVNSCNNKKPGEMLADAEVCENYYVCVHGKPVSMTCALGTRFHPQKMMCLHKGIYPCTKEPEKEHDECHHQGHGVRMPHETDCTKYIQCVSGYSKVMDCPQGTIFFQNIGMCNFGSCPI